jgi:hypothetical protein
MPRKLSARLHFDVTPTAWVTDRELISLGPLFRRGETDSVGRLLLAPTGISWGGGNLRALPA